MEETLHTHYSAIMALNIFLVVLVMGTLWRLSAAHLCASNNETLQHLGAAMSFQF